MTWQYSNFNSVIIQKHVTALIDAKLEKLHNLSEESWYYWSEISCGTLRFDRKECEVNTLREFRTHPFKLKLCVTYFDFLSLRIWLYE